MKTLKFFAPAFVLFLLATLYSGFRLPAETFEAGKTGWVLFLHVPAAWTGALSFITAGFSASFFLKTRRETLAVMMHNAAILGVIFMTLATVSGAIWARFTWGSYWNWDVRQTSILLLLLVYAAYFALRTFSNSKRALTVSAAYLVYAAMLMPLFVFVIPRLYPTLHPQSIINRQGVVHFETGMRITLGLSIVTATLLFIVLIKFMNARNARPKQL